MNYGRIDGHYSGWRERWRAARVIDEGAAGHFDGMGEAERYEFSQTVDQ